MQFIPKVIKHEESTVYINNEHQMIFENILLKQGQKMNAQP